MPWLCRCRPLQCGYRKIGWMPGISIKALGLCCRLPYLRRCRSLLSFSLRACLSAQEIQPIDGILSIPCRLRPLPQGSVPGIGNQVHLTWIHLDDATPVGFIKGRFCGHSLVVKPQPSKLVSSVRSRVPAPFKNPLPNFLCKIFIAWWETDWPFVISGYEVLFFLSFWG